MQTQEERNIWEFLKKKSISDEQGRQHMKLQEERHASMQQSVALAHFNNPTQTMKRDTIKSPVVLCKIQEPSNNIKAIKVNCLLLNDQSAVSKKFKNKFL